MSERLFDDHPRPMVVVLFRQTGAAELFHNSRKKTRGYSKVKELVAVGMMGVRRFVNLYLESLIGLGILKVALHKVNALRQFVPHLQVDRVGREVRHFLTKCLAEGLRVQVIRRESHNRELL